MKKVPQSVALIWCVAAAVVPPAGNALVGYVDEAWFFAV